MEVDVSYTIMGSEERYKAVSRNVGGGGIRFWTFQQLDEGAELIVTVRLPERGKPVAFLGKVAWAQPQGEGCEVGVQFVRIEPEERAAIIRYAMSRPSV